MPNVPIKVTADTKAAIKRVQGMVIGMKREMGKLATVGASKGVDKRAIEDIVKRVVSGQKTIRKEIAQTKKTTTNWLNEYRKLMATAQKRGVGAGTKQLALQQAKGVVSKRIKQEAAKGTEADPELLRKNEKRLQAIHKVQQKTYVVARKRAQLIKQIATQQAVLNTAHEKYRHGVVQTKEQFKAQVKLNSQNLVKLNKTEAQLKTNLNIIQQIRRAETSHLKAGKGVGAATGFTPDASARKQARESMWQKGEAEGLVSRRNLDAMEKVRGFTSDIAKYAKFQIRWFASATAIFATAGALVAAGKAALGYYQALKNIAAITDKTDEQMKVIGDAALYVAETTPIAASAAVKMSLKLVQAGLDTKDAAEALKTTAAVVTVSGEDMDTVAKAVTTVMFAWHKGAEEVADIGNVLAGALNYSRLTVEDLGTAFNYLAATSSIMGRSLEETSSTLSVLSNMGIRASTIGTGLSQLMTQLIAPTATLGKELKRIGVSANEINPSMNKFVDILKVLEKSTFSTTKAMDILGARAGRILAAALVAGSAEFERMEKKISRQGQLQKALAKTMEGPINALKNMRNQLEIAAIQIGSVAVPTLNLLIKIMKAFFSIIKLVTTGLSSLVEIFGGTNVAIGLFVTAIGGLIFKLNGLKVAGIAATVSMAGLKTVMLAHPILMFVGAITAALGVFGLFKRSIDNVAESHKKLGEIQDSLAAKAAQFKAQQQALERTVTIIVEAWSSYKDPIIRLPFAAEARDALMWMGKMQSELSNINETVVKYQDHIAELQQRKFSIKTISEMKDINKQIKRFEKGIDRAKDMAVIAAASIDQSFRKTMGNLAKYSPETVGGLFVKGVISKEKSEVEALAQLEKDIQRLARTAQTALTAARDKYNKGMIDAKNDLKAQEEVMALYNASARSLLPKFIAIEDAANKISVSTKNLQGRTKDYANALLRVRKQLVKMREEYKVLVTDDPFLEIHLNTKRRVQEIALEHDKYNKKLLEVNALIAKLPQAAVTKELKKQQGQLTQIRDVLRDQEATVRKIGNEKARILRKEIADGVHKLRIENELFNVEQKILALKLSGGTALAIYREEVRLKNELLDIKIRELEAERQIAIAKFDGAKVIELSSKIATEKAKKVEKPAQQQVEMEMIAGEGVTPESLFSQRQTELDAQYAQYSEHVTNKGELDAWYLFKKQELDAQELANTQKMNRAKVKGASDTAGALGSVLETMNQVRERKSRKLFEAMKIARIAEATINTYAAAQGAWNDTPGPVWVRAAAAAVAVAAGLANVASISQTSFGTGGGGGGAAAASAPEYKYYSYEQSGYAGTGWRPGEGQGGYNEYVGAKPATGEAPSVVQKITINAMDSKSVEQLVNDNPAVFTAPVIQDIKDGGPTQQVIIEYNQ